VQNACQPGEVYQSPTSDAKALPEDGYDPRVFRPTPQGPITRLRMASTFLGRPVYAVSAYAFADLLIDTGPPQTAAQLVEWCRESAVQFPRRSGRAGCITKLYA
jgi:hypothetical protein